MAKWIVWICLTNIIVVSAYFENSRYFFKYILKVKCKDDEYPCLLSKQCIPKVFRCNDKFNCELKEDELDCCKNIFQLLPYFPP